MESHPNEGLKIMDNGLFWSACCDELKEAVLKRDIEPIANGMRSDACMFIRSPQLIAKIQNSEDLDYSEDYFIATDQCPFCGGHLYDRPVNMDGINPYDYENYR